MKWIKRICLCVFTLLVAVVALNNNKLISYALDYLYNADTLPVGTILKSGDLFTFDFDNSSQDRCQGGVIGLVLEYNGYDYLYAINSQTGELSSKNYYGYLGGINTDYFEQKNIGEMPFVEGKTVLWEYQGGSGLGAYCMTTNHFIGHVYEEPEFNLYCDSTNMTKDDKVACQVTVEYSDVPTDVEFEISSKDFYISDVKVMDEWDRVDEEKFVFEAVDLQTNKYDDSRVEVDIIEFYITPKEEDFVKVEDAVVLENVSWIDDYAEKKLEDKEYEPMEPIKEEEELIEIPQTGVESYLLLGILVALLGIVFYKKITEKGTFKKL